MTIDQIFALARASEFQPFSVVTNSGTRYHIKTRDHISFGPAQTLAKARKAPWFVVWTDDLIARHVAADNVSSIEPANPQRN
jgi:hypothetical protein